MLVSWQLPEGVARALTTQAASLVVGLVRFGVATNKTSVVNKNVAVAGGAVGQPAGPGVAGGRVEFHAPRSAGVFVYRIYEPNSTSQAAYRIFDEAEPTATYASSPPFAVGVQVPTLGSTVHLLSVFSSPWHADLHSPPPFFFFCVWVIVQPISVPL